MGLDQSQQRQYLDEMGIRVWVRRSLPQPEEVNALPESMASHTNVQEIIDPAMAITAAVKTVVTAKVSQDWDTLASQVTNCTACELSKVRTQTVFGVGNREADWLIIGEAPGAEEDRQGEPFVGRAGQLLTEMLRAIGLTREQVYIANILKCRPPNNRDPKPEEVVLCDAFLTAQINLIKPKIILAVGRIAAQNLLKSDTAIGQLRGRSYLYGEQEIPLVVTYHPAYLLRSPLEKRKTWNDLKLAVKIFKES
ncbi:MAG: uracil-DNA glycosylase [Gammaproteobacteria bacterium]|nr:uracil-DNA glycosylase [Gammaproteobacteria bacterium]